jgi:hypothetical protein
MVEVQNVVACGQDVVATGFRQVGDHPFMLELLAKIYLFSRFKATFYICTQLFT